MRHLRYLIPMVFLAISVGCATKSATDTGDSAAPEESRATPSRVDDDRAQPGAPMPSDGGLNLVDDRTVYFAFDSAEIRAADRELVRMHGRNLADNSDLSLRLEGHADERGTREYNIGLGERRAQAVKAALMVQGASADQLTTVSYGEERPAVLGSNESAWAQNRRVEMAYGR
ncbi:MAG: peptidoglycan-associated lipoprotein Pal [Gammaproteobacteria bacterium]|nr:peptidoglycan-associated lipoprotein Pal [Gammaproteobacteria bacterium]